MRNDNDPYKYMVGGEIASEDVASWSDPEGNLQVVITPGQGSKIRIPLLIFKARLLLAPCGGTSPTRGI